MSKFSMHRPTDRRFYNTLRSALPDRESIRHLSVGLSVLCMSLAGCINVHAQDPGSIPLETCELLVPGTSLSVVGQCGWLEVAENPAEPEGRKIQLRVARIPARGRESEPDPLVFFAGGPGQSALETWPMMSGALRKLNHDRDILLVDQRGTGQSNPMKCDPGDMETMLSTDWSDVADATRECLAGIEGDPRFYTTTIAMHDIDKVREAMGYDQLNLFGGSYGTRAAQVYLRLYPEHVRSVVLDSVVPQTLVLGSEHAQKLDQAITRVLDGCDADEDCHQAFPDTSGKLTALLNFLSENPQQVTVEHPTTGKPYEVNFDRDLLAGSLRFLTYSADSQAMLPLLIHEAATEGRYDRLASQLLIATAGLQQSIAQGMALSVGCAEDWPLFTEPGDMSEYLMGDTMYRAMKIQCGIWPRGERPENFHEAVESEVPVLLLSGEVDPVTPQEYGEQTKQGFSNSLHLVARGQGHIASTRGCMGRIVTDFVQAASVENLDTECMDNLQASPYFLDLTGPRP